MTNSYLPGGAPWQSIAHQQIDNYHETLLMAHLPSILRPASLNVNIQHHNSRYYRWRSKKNQERAQVAVLHQKLSSRRDNKNIFNHLFLQHRHPHMIRDRNKTLYGANYKIYIFKL